MKTGSWLQSILARRSQPLEPLQAEETSGLPEGHTRIWPPFRRVEGFAHRTPVAPVLKPDGDPALGIRRCRISLCEDGVKLAHPCATSDEVARLGGGRYRHDGQALIFSSSDNTNPSTNGRVYSWVASDPLPKILALGGCRLREAVALLHKRGAADADLEGIDVSTSSAEHLSLAKQGMGEAVPPPWLMELTRFSDPEWRAKFRRAAHRPDVLIVEISANASVTSAEAVLIRNEINGFAKEITDRAPPEARTSLQTWYMRGIEKCDEEARRKASDDALNLIHGSDVDSPFVRDILLTARGVRHTPADMETDLRALQDLVGCHRLVLVSTPNVFTPDGRGVSWFPNLFSDVRIVAENMGVPLIEVGELLLDYEGESVLADMIHLTPSFLQFFSDHISKELEEINLET